MVKPSAPGLPGCSQASHGSSQANGALQSRKHCESSGAPNVAHVALSGQAREEQSKLHNPRAPWPRHWPEAHKAFWGTPPASTHDAPSSASVVGAKQASLHSPFSSTSSGRPGRQGSRPRNRPDTMCAASLRGPPGFRPPNRRSCPPHTVRQPNRPARRFRVRRAEPRTRHRRPRRHRHLQRSRCRCRTADRGRRVRP